MPLDADADPARGDADPGQLLRDFAEAFHEVWSGRGLTSDGIVELAAKALPHAVGCGLTLVRNGRAPTTLASSDELAERIDQLQIDTGEGPCLDAIENDDIVRADDLPAAVRWPKFSQRAVAETVVRSMFGLRVVLGNGDRGALNFFADEPRAFTDLDFGIGAVFSTVTSLALRNEIERTRSVNLEVAVESSRRIGMAMGILMSSRLLTAEQAFDELRRASQLLHRKLHDVAADVMETGALPDLPS